MSCNVALRIKCEEKGEDFPTVEQFLKLHEGGDAYRLFVTEILKAAIGKSTWDRYCTKKLICAFVTRSDEAYALLNVENQYDRWTYMWQNNDHRDKERKAPNPLYTNGGKSGGGRGSNRKNDGWSKEGFERFNKIHQNLGKDRELLSRVKFEEDLMNELKAEQANKRIRKKQLDEEDDMGVPYAAHDFDDVNAGGLENCTITTDGGSADEDWKKAESQKGGGSSIDEHENGSENDDSDDDDDNENDGEDEEDDLE